MRFRDLRFPCDVELTAACAGMVRRVRLVNISVTGARLAGLGVVPRGAPLILCLLDGRYVAQVVWSNERETGLRFTPELTPNQVNALRGVVGAGRPEAWVAPSTGFRELT
jgi:hypothetical protein